MTSSWNFLDTVDFNTLYNYAEVLKGNGKQIHSSCNFLEQDDDICEKEIREIRKNMERKKRAWYLIWIAYRYILNCPDLESARPYMNKETLDMLYLKPHIKAIYLGVDDENLVLPSGIILSLRKIWCRNDEDIEIILEILYNRYNFYEQFECFIRHTKATRQYRAKVVLESYKDLERILSNR